MVITVGSLDGSEINKIKNICNKSKNGLLIQASGDASGIEEAFGKVGKMIAGQVNVERL